MTFNRYICFCAILESIGAIACMLMALIGNNLLGVIVAAIAACVLASWRPLCERCFSAV